MTPAIANYYPIAISFAITAAVVISLYVVGARRWSGAAVVGNATTVLLSSPVTDTAQDRNSGLRLVAICGAADLPAGRMRSIARQSIASRIRALEGAVSNNSHDARGLELNLAGRRPGLQKASARGGHRLVVVR